MIYIGSRYEVIEEIGRGCRCCLYKCVDTYSMEMVIVSIIDSNVEISKTFVSNLIDESTIISELNSPYILDIKDVGIHELENGCELYYIVSEYIEGNTLEELNKYHSLSIEEIVLIFRQVLSGLEVAHSYDVHHGYLQPSNIIIDEGYNVKISNLGIIKSNNNIFNNSISVITQSLRYLSPQQICLNYSDKSSDFFSLGIILFELIFKEHPFGIIEDNEEMLKIIDKGINWNKFDTRDIPSRIIHIINKLLSRSNKYNTPKEVIIDLSEYMYEIENIQYTPKEEVVEEVEVEQYYPKIKKRKLFRKITLAGGITFASIMILGMII